jgi:formylglycine-generating enzyme required for sulfatase activity
MMYRILFLIAVLSLGIALAGCLAPQPAPDASATEAVIAARIFATLTAAAPSPALQTALPFISTVAPSPMTIPPTLTPMALPPTPSSTAPVAGMVWVPEGEFTMGSDGDPAASADEKPQHRAHVKDFWISRTEVTNAQYALCVEAGACTAPDNQDYDQLEFANRPVADVSWQDANAYARWAGGRLPTEAEWEKACRGTDARIYPWGNEVPTDKLLNYDVPIGGATTDVGSYSQGASPYGLLDMMGNVWEWTSSEFRGYPYAEKDGREDADAAKRVLRGGAYYEVAANVRCAVRIWNLPGDRYKGFGFRVVASPLNQ